MGPLEIGIVVIVVVGILDNVARRMVTPIITRQITKIGLPGIDMDNVLIVDRPGRAPR